MKIGLLPMSALLALTGLQVGCAVAPPAPARSDAPTSVIEAGQPTAAVPLAPKQVVTFIDLDSFDRDMERALSSGANEVQVRFSAPMSPNAISPRLGRWLNTVQETGGEVEVRNENRTRSLGLLAALAEAAYAAWRDSRTKALVKGMKVEIGVGANEIQTLVFKRKP
jgi:hypothetical protein